MNELKPGWYAIGFRHDDGKVRYDDILRYHAGAYWTDDSGERIERIWCPILQQWVSMDAADDYLAQS